MGLGIGTGLLVLGIVLGAWMARRSQPLQAVTNGVDPQQFLLFIQNLSRWTNEVAGDVNKYHYHLNNLSRQVENDSAKPSSPEMQGLLQKIMEANRELQSRLDNAEEKLESQTKEIASYLTEARTDGLTGLANRRAFDQQLDEQFRDFAQSKRVFSLALLDIDHFKKINDTYGHPAGDAVLKEVSSRLRMQLPMAIQIARYGGEEFAVLLAFPLRQAAEIIEQLRIFMASAEIQAEGHSLKVSVSCGVAEVGEGERIGKLVRRSDEALYSSKLGGRNRVFIHDGRLCQPFGKPSPNPLVAGNTNALGESIRADGPEDSAENDPLRERIQQRLVRILNEEAKRQSV